MNNDDLKWIFDKLEQMGDKQDKHTEIMTRLMVSLEHHVQKTKQLEMELKPVKAHVQLVNTGVKLLSAVGAIAVGAHRLGMF